MNIYSHLAMAPSPSQGGGSSLISTYLMLGMIVVIFYFMIWRPQQKRQKERKALLDDVKKGDKIVTIGGCHGVIVGVEEKTLLVQVADNVKLKFEKTAVASIMREGETILAEKAQ